MRFRQAFIFRLPLISCVASKGVKAAVKGEPVRVLFLCRTGLSSEGAWRSFSDFVRVKRARDVTADCVNLDMGEELAVSRVLDCDHVVVPINVLADAQRILQELKRPPVLHNYTTLRHRQAIDGVDWRDKLLRRVRGARM